MAALLTNAGEATLLNWAASILEGAPAAKQGFLRLFINDYTPVAGCLVTDFTEAGFKGYPAGGELLDAWTAAAVDGNGAIIAADQKIFAYDSGEAGTSDEPVYGAYFVDEDDNVIAAERLPGAPITMNADGQEIRYTQKLKLTEITEACE